MLAKKKRIPLPLLPNKCKCLSYVVTHTIMYDVDERRNTCLAGDGWNASGQTPYYELILYLVVRTPPSISTHTLVHNIRGVIILLYVYYELVFINNTSYSISTLESILLCRCTQPENLGGIIESWQRRRDPGGRLNTHTICTMHTSYELLYTTLCIVARV